MSEPHELDRGELIRKTKLRVSVTLIGLWMMKAGTDAGSRLGAVAGLVLFLLGLYYCGPYVGESLARFSDWKHTRAYEVDE